MVVQFSRSKNQERRPFRCSILPFRGYSCVFIPRKARTVFGILSRRERNLEILGRRSRRSGRRGDFIDPRCEPFGALSGGELCTGKNCNRGQDTLERLIIRLLNPVTGLVNLFPFFFHHCCRVVERGNGGGVVSRRRRLTHARIKMYPR